MAAPGLIRRALYVTVSGNTGVGKSTLLARLASHLREREINPDVAHEQQFHHPMLANMFREPATWAFAVQVNFALERTMRLMTIDGPAGRPLLMERSLSEDVLFFRYYRERGDISDDQAQAYEHLFGCLAARVDEPDLVIHLVGDESRICDRLETAFARGERPGEYRGPQLRHYVATMNRLYDEWGQSARDRSGGYVRIEVDRDRLSADAVFETARQHLMRAVRQ